MSLTEKLFLPILRSNGSAPLVTYYDDATGGRVELSSATIANWAAKTANWLRDEMDVEAGDRVVVQLPAHWQTVGILLGVWWTGAHLVSAASGRNAKVAFVGPEGKYDDADEIAVVALDPMGMGLRTPPTVGVDFLTESRIHGDVFSPWDRLPADAPALDDLSVQDVLNQAAAQQLPSHARVLTTHDWTAATDWITELLAVLSVGGSLVLVAHADDSKLESRMATEKCTIRL